MPKRIAQRINWRHEVIVAALITGVLGLIEMAISKQMGNEQQNSTVNTVSANSSSSVAIGNNSSAIAVSGNGNHIKR